MGMRMFSTSEVMMALKATPTTTATARSIDVAAGDKGSEVSEKLFHGSPSRGQVPHVGQGLRRGVTLAPLESNKSPQSGRPAAAPLNQALSPSTQASPSSQPARTFEG